MPSAYLLKLCLFIPKFCEVLTSSDERLQIRIFIVNFDCSRRLSTLVSHEALKRHVKEYKHDKQMVEVTKEMCKPHYAEFTKLPSPRFFKSHMPISLLPPSLLDTCKVVFVARDPRDVAVSFYHLCRLFKLIGYSGDLKTFWNYFIKGLGKYV